MGPVVSIGIKPFTSQKERPESGKIVLLDIFPLRIFLLDGPEGSGSSEHHLYAVLRYHTPECSGIRCSDRFPSYNIVVQPIRSGA